MTGLRKNLLIAMLGAAAFIIMFTIGIPILPSAAFLKYEPSGMVILVAAALLGPVGGLVACLIKDLLFFLIGAGNIFGVCSDFVNTAAYALAAGCLLYRKPDVKGRLAAYAAGTLAGTLVMIPANLVILQMEFGMTVETILAMMVPVIIPFNLLKGLLNSLIFHFLGRPVVAALRPAPAGAPVPAPGSPGAGIVPQPLSADLTAEEKQSSKGELS